MAFWDKYMKRESNLEKEASRQSNLKSYGNTKAKTILTAADKAKKKRDEDLAALKDDYALMHSQEEADSAVNAMTGKRTISKPGNVTGTTPTTGATGTTDTTKPKTESDASKFFKGALSKIGSIQTASENKITNSSDYNKALTGKDTGTTTKRSSSAPTNNITNSNPKLNAYRNALGGQQAKKTAPAPTQDITGNTVIGNAKAKIVADSIKYAAENPQAPVKKAFSWQTEPSKGKTDANVGRTTANVRKSDKLGDVVANSLEKGTDDLRTQAANMVRTYAPGLSPEYEQQLKDVVENSEKNSAQYAEQLDQLTGAKKFLSTGLQGAPGVVVPAALGSAMAAGAGALGAGAVAVKTIGMVPFGMQAAGGYARQAELEGATEGQQKAYGLVGGTLEGLTEMVPLGKLKGLLGGDYVDKGAKTLIGKYGKVGLEYLKAVGLEAVQEGAIDPFTGLAKKGIYDNDMAWTGEGGVVDGKQILGDMYAGAAMGAVLGGLSMPAGIAKATAEHYIENKIIPDQKQTQDLENQIEAESKWQIERPVGLKQAGSGASQIDTNPAELDAWFERAFGKTSEMSDEQIAGHISGYAELATDVLKQSNGVFTDKVAKQMDQITYLYKQLKAEQYNRANPTPTIGDVVGNINVADNGQQPEQAAPVKTQLAGEKTLQELRQEQGMLNLEQQIIGKINSLIGQPGKEGEITRHQYMLRDVHEEMDNFNVNRLAQTNYVDMSDLNVGDTVDVTLGRNTAPDSTIIGFDGENVEIKAADGTKYSVAPYQITALAKKNPRVARVGTIRTFSGEVVAQEPVVAPEQKAAGKAPEEAEKAPEKVDTTEAEIKAIEKAEERAKAKGKKLNPAMQKRYKDLKKKQKQEKAEQQAELDATEEELRSIDFVKLYPEEQSRRNMASQSARYGQDDEGFKAYVSSISNDSAYVPNPRTDKTAKLDEFLEAIKDFTIDELQQIHKAGVSYRNEESGRKWANPEMLENAFNYGMFLEFMKIMSEKVLSQSKQFKVGDKVTFWYYSKKSTGTILELSDGKFSGGLSEAIVPFATIKVDADREGYDYKTPVYGLTFQLKAPEAGEKAPEDKHEGFKKGDRVEWEQDGKTLTGTIRGISDYSDINKSLGMVASIDTDIEPIHGISITRISTVSLGELRKEGTKVEEKAPKAPETKPEQQPGEFKLGRAGKAAYKKWGENERVNADLNDQADPYTIAYTEFFTYWYKKGWLGEKKTGVGNQVIFNGETFPPFLEDIFYKAGEQDAKGKGTGESDKAPEVKRPLTKAQLVDYYANSEITDWIDYMGRPEYDENAPDSLKGNQSKKFSEFKKKGGEIADAINSRNKDAILEALGEENKIGNNHVQELIDLAVENDRIDLIDDDGVKNWFVKGEKVMERDNPKKKGTIVGFYGGLVQVDLANGDQLPTSYGASLLRHDEEAAPTEPEKKEEPKPELEVKVGVKVETEDGRTGTVIHIKKQDNGVTFALVYMDETDKTIHLPITKLKALETPEWKEPTGRIDSSYVGSHFIKADGKLVKSANQSAEAKVLGEDTISISDKFEALDKEHQKQIIIHEVGHILSGLLIQKHVILNPENALGRYNVKKMYFEGVFGETSPEEAWATAFKVYHNNPAELEKRYPLAYKFVDRMVKQIPETQSFVDYYLGLLDEYNGIDAKFDKLAESFKRGTDVSTPDGPGVVQAIYKDDNEIKVPVKLNETGKVKIYTSNEVSLKETPDAKAAIDRADMSPQDLAADYKARGMNPVEAYAQYLLDTNSNSPLDKNRFYDIFKKAIEKKLDQPLKEGNAKTEPPQELSPVERYIQDTDFTLKSTKHTKTGAALWVLNFNENIDREHWKDLLAYLNKEVGKCSFSRFLKGIMFHADPTAKLNELKGEAAEDKSPETVDIPVKPDYTEGDKTKDSDNNTVEGLVEELTAAVTKTAKVINAVKSGDIQNAMIEIVNAIYEHRGNMTASKAESVPGIGKVLNEFYYHVENNIDDIADNIYEEMSNPVSKGGENNDNQTNGDTDDGSGEPGNVPGPKGKGPTGEGGGTTSGTDTGNGITDVQRPGDKGNGGNGGTKLPEEGGDVQHDTTPSDGDSDGGTESVPTATGNYRITDTEAKTYSPKKVFRENVDAIKTLRTIMEENRKATIEEQEILAKYRGWGGMPGAFNTYHNNTDWKNEARELKELLTAEEYDAAKRSTLDSFYTDNNIIKSMYEALDRLGFGGGRILEPAMGIGKFFGNLPGNMQKSRLTGVELDNISGQIANLLYPNADIRVQGFETTEFPDNYFDVAIGNVPFGESHLRYKKVKFLIHDFFFLQTLDKVRPGGVVAFITSKGTLDKGSQNVKKLIMAKADLVGAIRLPNNAFKGEANTGVTSDILFFQKREEGTDYSGEAFLNLDYLKNDVEVNEYFVNHPEMIMGKMENTSTRFGWEPTCSPDGRDLTKALTKAILSLPEGVYKKPQVRIKEPAPVNLLDKDMNLKEGGYGIKDGKVYQRKGGTMIEVTAKVEIFKGMINLKKAIGEVLRVQQEGAPTEVVKNAQALLNAVYDSFVKKNGYATLSSNKKMFKEDPEYPLIMALEDVKEWSTGRTKEPVRVERAAIFSIEPNIQVDHCENLQDALGVAMNEFGFVNIHRMATLTGKTGPEVVKELKGQIYENPTTGNYETAAEYLSGNVVEKLKVAEFMAKNNPEFNEHVEALKKVQPERIQALDIDVKLGNNWIPIEAYEQFFKSLYGSRDKFPIKLSYDKSTGSWKFDINRGVIYGNQAIEKSRYGTKNLRASDLLEKIFNNKPIKIVLKDADGNKFTDKEQTELAKQKAEDLNEALKKWLFDENPDRRKLIEDIYNEKMNNIKNREYDGSFLTFPGMSKTFDLRDYQRDAVLRIIQDGRALLAHAVGSGKTCEMQAAGMELKRLGLAKKPMFAIKKDMVESGQFENEFRRLYPAANILCATSADLSKDKRAEFMSKIATGDWDAVIISHDSFNALPVRDETAVAFIEEELRDLEEAILANDDESRGNAIVKDLEARKADLEAKLDELLNGESKDNTINFEDLGVDFLFVDEAHNFKNLYVTTKLGRVKGVSRASAQKSSDLYMKIRHIYKINGSNRGVVFATGTPISNSGVELFTMMRYLEPDILEAAGVKSFDAWANNFGSITTALELDQTGKGFKMVERFRNFSNVPELMKMYRTVADIKTAKQINLPTPELEGGMPIKVEGEASEAVIRFMQDELPDRIDAVSSGTVDKSEDNHLKIYSDGIKVAIDARLLEPDAEDDPNSKLNKCVELVYKEWKAGKADKTTQLIFLDQGMPDGKAKINLYGEIKRKLVDMGIPANEIEFIHNANTKPKQTALLNKMSTGDVRILLGSTAKMGEGKNVQKRLIAMHEMDIPKRPSDIEQRRGRIVRFGNENKVVRIYSYLTPGSFDGYSFQMLENKQILFSSFLDNPEGNRTLLEPNDFCMQLNEMKASGTGNPDIIRYANVEQELTKLTILRRAHKDSVYRAQEGIPKEQHEIEFFGKMIADLKIDLEKYNSNKPEEFKITVKDKVYEGKDKKEEAGKAILEAIKKLGLEDEGKIIGEYAGFKMMFKMSLDTMSGSVRRGLYLDGKADKYTVEPSESPTGTITKIINQLDNIESRIERLEGHIESSKNNIKIFQEELAKPFTKEAELQKLQAEKVELLAKLQIDKQDDSHLYGEVEDEKGTGKGNNDSDDYDDDDEQYSYAAPSPTPSKGTSSGQATNQGTGQATNQGSGQTTTQQTTTKGSTEKLMKRQTMINELMNTLEVPLRKGRIRGQRRLGVFKVWAEVIRVRKNGDIPTITHEAGHYLDKLFSLVELANGTTAEGKAIKKELMELGKVQAKQQNLTGKDQMMEGVAEFVSFYLMNQPTNSPKFEARFELILSKSNPAMYKGIQLFKERYAKYENADPEARMLSHMHSGKTTLRGKFRKFREKHNFDTFMENWVDELRPLFNLTKRGKTTGIDDNPYEKAWLFRGWVGKAETYLKHGVYEWQDDGNGGTKRVKVCDSLEAIMKPVNDRMDSFLQYAIARRAIEKDQQQLATGYKYADTDAVYNRYKDDKTFNDAFDQLQDYQDALLRMLVKSGLVAPSSYAAMKVMNEDYVPFYRLLDTEGEKAAAKYMGKSFTNLSKPIRMYKGDEGDIINPLESIIKNTYYFVNIAERNEVGLSLVKFAKNNEGMGEFIENVSPILKPQMFDLSEIKKALIAAKVDIDTIDLDTVATIFRPILRGNPNDHTVAIHENGNARLYQLHPDVYRAVTTFDKPAFTLGLELLTQPAKILRAGAVFNPDFAAKNPIRDTFTAGLYSKYGFIPIVDTIRGLYHVAKQDELYDLWLESGGASAEQVALDRDYLGDALKDLMLKKGVAHKLGILVHPIKALQIISAFSEEGTRVGEFRKGVKKEGMTEEGVKRAALSSRDVTLDFSRSGHYGKQINRWTAFFNATIQGSDKMLRTLASRNTPVKTKALVMFKATMYLTVPTVLIWAFNNGDDEKREIYNELPSWRKNLCWNIVIDADTVLSLPKPFELGMVFGSSVESALNFAYNNDENAMKQWAIDTAKNTLPGILPTASVPIVEAMTDYSFFTGLPITNLADDGVKKSEQYNTSTSNVAKNIGSAAGFFTEEGWSPKKIDNTIYGYTGGLGRYAVNIMDYAGGQVSGDYNPKASSDLRRIPGLKGLLAEPYTSSASMSEYYSNKASITHSYNSAAKIFKAEHPEISDKEWTKRVKDDRLPTAELNVLHRIKSEFTDVDKKLKAMKDKEDAIRSNSSLSASEKQAQVNELNKTRATMTRNFNVKAKALMEKLE